MSRQDELREAARLAANETYARHYAGREDFARRERTDVENIVSAVASDAAVLAKTTAKTFHETFVSTFMKLWTADHNELPEVKAAQEAQLREWRIRSFARKLDSMIESADAQIVKYIAELQQNPKYAMEWSDSSFVAAANKDAALRIKAIFESNDPEHGGYDNAIRMATAEALRMGRSSSRSTSEPHNIVERYTLAAYADIAEGRMF